MKLNSMITYSFLLSSMLLLVGCGGNSSSSTSAAFDTSGYESLDVGGGITKLTKKGSDGSVIEEGYIYNGLKNGVWSTYYPDNDRVKTFQSFVNGSLTGPTLEMSNRGQIDAKKTFGNNQLDGMSSSYKFGKAITEIPYKLGKINGKFREYQDSKLHKEIDYVDGKRNGKMLYFDADGNVTVEYDYKNDEKVGGGMVESK